MECDVVEGLSKNAALCNRIIMVTVPSIQMVRDDSSLSLSQTQKSIFILNIVKMFA